jgi:preprotein translocase subunit YajC
VKHFAVFALASAALVPGAALAQAPAQAPTTAPAAGAAPTAGAAVTTGATVYDTSGGVVGTVESTDGTNAVVNTGTVKAAIPLTSLGKGAQGPVLAMTKAQLEAAAGQQQAQASAEFKSKLVPGATVYGTGGAQLGTIKSVDASGVTLTTADGDAVLPVTGFGPGPQGILLGMTADQLKAAMTAAAPAASATAATDAAATTDQAATTTETTTTTTKSKRKPR